MFNKTSSTVTSCGGFEVGIDRARVDEEECDMTCDVFRRSKITTTQLLSVDHRFDDSQLFGDREEAPPRR